MKLVIHAPTSKAQSERKRSFSETVDTKVGDGYALSRNEYPLAMKCSEVIVLDNERENRAKGRLVRIEQEGWTRSGMPRYNIHMDNLRIERYEYVKVNRRGIAFV